MCVHKRLHKRSIDRDAEGFIKESTVREEKGEVEMQQKQNEIK
jgi:hypothetical protein